MISPFSILPVAVLGIAISANLIVENASVFDQPGASIFCVVETAKSRETEPPLLQRCVVLASNIVVAKTIPPGIYTSVANPMTKLNP